MSDEPRDALADLREISFRRITTEPVARVTFRGAIEDLLVHASGPVSPPWPDAVTVHSSDGSVSQYRGR